jgi:hypothetical protein
MTTWPSLELSFYRAGDKDKASKRICDRLNIERNKITPLSRRERCRETDARQFRDQTHNSDTVVGLFHLPLEDLPSSPSQLQTIW